MNFNLKVRKICAPINSTSSGAPHSHLLKVLIIFEKSSILPPVKEKFVIANPTSSRITDCQNAASIVFSYALAKISKKITHRDNISHFMIFFKTSEILSTKSLYKIAPALEYIPNYEFQQNKTALKIVSPFFINIFCKKELLCMDFSDFRAIL